MLTQNGIDYICQNFGDTNFCCASTGLNWFYTVSGVEYGEYGGTAQIVSRLASGLIDSLTMTSPERGTFTQAELDSANGTAVTLEDAKEITFHDDPFEDPQWCYLAPPQNCSDYLNQTDCETAGCYWWSDGTCHSDPEQPPPPPSQNYWPYVFAIAIAGTAAALLILRRKK